MSGATPPPPGPAVAGPSAAAPMSRRQIEVLVALTLVWGLNWPVMKMGISGLPDAPASYPPMTFRTLSIVLGLPVLAGAMAMLKVPFAVPRAHWPALVQLTLTNSLVWNVTVILALRELTSGRSALLAYTMPTFAALWGALLYGDRLAPRQWAGVLAAGAGVALLLASEFTAFSGSPLAALALVASAAVWALGTHQLGRSTVPLPVLTISFWMVALTGVVACGLAAVFERDLWRVPQGPALVALVFNAVLVFGFSQSAWFYLARTLPAVAAGISVMMIPVLGVYSGALALGEPLHLQDHVAVVMIVLAIGLVMRRR